MAFPIKVCVVCEEEFELRPDKPGFANRCPQCSSPETSEADGAGKGKMDADERKATAEANEARRQAMKNLLYRRDS
jgi:predicted amidophosphoribosyltransferase